MTVHELMVKTNHYLIKGGELTGAQKAKIAGQLLAARSDGRTYQSFIKGVKAPEYLFGQGQSNDSRVMYPLFFIPPYNDGKKLQTVIPMSPKTHILAANSYELEILRLLCLFAPDAPDVKKMTAKTLARLKTTCFAYQDCHYGECFHSALIALRFLAAASDELEWMKKLIKFFNKYNGETRRHSGTIWYYWLCLSELPFEAAEAEIEKNKPQMLLWLTSKSAVMNSENDKTTHPVLYCILRNCMSRLPEYAYIQNREPFVSEKDGRLHFNMSR